MFPDELRSNEDYFKIKDVVYRINQGNASIGSKRYNVLIEGPSGNWEDDILIDVKDEFLPDMFQSDAAFKPNAAFYQAAYGDNHAKRAVEAYRAMAANPDPFLGVLELGGDAFMVKAIAVSKNDYVDFIRSGSFENKDDMADYLKYTATAFALAHARGAVKMGDDDFAEQVVAALDNLSPAAFMNDISEIGENYYLQVNADFAQLQNDLRTGKLVDIRHLTHLAVSNNDRLATEITEGESVEAAELVALDPVFSTLHPYPSYSDKWPVLSFQAKSLSDASTVRVAATAADSEALVSIGGLSAEIGESEREIVLGANRIVEITVTARDGSTMTFRVSFADGDNGSGTNPGSGSGNNPGSGSGSNPGSGSGNNPGSGSGSNPGSGSGNNPGSGSSSNPGSGDNSGDGGQGSDEEGNNDVRFTDTAGHWAGATISRAVQLGFINGYGDGSFKPDQQITRAEFAVLLARLLKWDDAGQASAFADQSEIKDWAAAAVKAAASRGIITGYGNGSFQPNKAINRAEMAVMIARSLHLSAPPEGEQLPLPDAGSIPAWALGSVNASFKAGLLTGRTSGNFDPGAPASRAEAIVVLLRALDAELIAAS